ASVAPSRLHAWATPYAIERLDRTPVIRILRSARNPIASAETFDRKTCPPSATAHNHLRSLICARSFAFTHLRSLICVHLFAFNNTAGEPVVGDAEFGPRVRLCAVVNDDRASDDVGRSAVAHRDSADAGQ